MVWAESRIPLGLASVMVATVPLWMIFLDWVRPQGVRCRGRVLWGLLIGFAGACLLAGPMKIAGATPPDAIGIGVLAFAALSWAARSHVRPGAALPSFPLLATGMEMLMGRASADPHRAERRREPARLSLATVSWQSWGAMGYLIVFGSLVGFSAYSWLLKVAPPTGSPPTPTSTRVIALLLGWGLGGKLLSVRTPCWPPPSSWPASSSRSVTGRKS